jgi:uncharacterized protein YgiM (DUF1202 family)
VVAIMQHPSVDRPGSLAVLRLSLVLAFAYLVAVLAFSQPSLSSSADSTPVAEVAAAVAYPAAEVTPAAPAGPTALTTLNVYVGPGELYQIVGLVAKGARLEVVGRDQEGDWLAIVFSRGSSLHGWVPRERVLGVEVAQLPVAPVTIPASP